MNDGMGMILTGGLLVFGVLLAIGFLLKGERFTMYQDATGKTIEVKRGFSFTYFFFGPFVPLFRGHIGGFFLSLFVELFTCGLARLVLLFCYNGMYINWLAANGFKRINTATCQIEGGKQTDGNRYKEADALMQPINSHIDDYDDEGEGETVALTGGTLVGLGGMYQGAELPMSQGDKIMIGRDGEKSNLVIADKEISRKHCEITYDSYNQTYVVCDYSTNGVYLEDGSRIAVQQPVYIRAGSIIQIGNTENVFQLK